MAPTPGDPFPRERFGALVRRLPRYARLGWRLSRHPKLSRSRRAALLAGLVYVASPIDLVPIIPVAGQLDDAAAMLIALGVALRGLSDEDRARLLAAANLAPGDIDDDLRTIGACYAWMGRSAGRVGVRATRAVGRAAARAAGGIAHRLRPGRS